MFNDDRHQARRLRQARVRRKLRGDAERPRLCVFRSERHMYVQVIADDTGRTLLAASTLAPDVRDQVTRPGPAAAPKRSAETAAKRCAGPRLTAAVFAHTAVVYHGRLRAPAQ